MGKLKEAVPSLMEHAREFIEGGEELIPILFVETSQGIGIAPQIAELSDTNAMSKVIPCILAGVKATSYVFICEAYATAIKDNEPLKDKLSNREMEIHDLPPDDRYDIVGCLYVENGGENTFWQAKVTKDRENKRHVGAFEELTKDKACGRLIVDKW